MERYLEQSENTKLDLGEGWYTTDLCVGASGGIRSRDLPLSWRLLQGGRSLVMSICQAEPPRRSASMNTRA